MRPSSFIAPLEKNVELSNGTAVVITIKTRRTGEKKTDRERPTKRQRLGKRGKHKT